GVVVVADMVLPPPRVYHVSPSGRMPVRDQIRRPHSHPAARPVIMTLSTAPADRTPAMPIPHVELPATRRDFLLRAGGGFGALALTYLLQRDGLRAAPADDPAANLLAPKPPHFPARAKSVIFL